MAGLSSEESTDKLAKISEYLSQYKKAKQHNQPSSITFLLDLAKDQNPRVRWRAIEALGSVSESDKTVDTFITAIQDPHHMVRWNTALALGELGDSRAILPLIEAIDDDSSNVKEMIKWALVELSANAIEIIIDTMSHQDWWIREEGARILGQIGGVQAREALLQALKDPNERVREKVVESLGNLGGVQTIEGLLTALQDKYGDTRQNAMEALVKIGSDAVDPLLDLLNKRNKTLRTIIAQILGDIGDPRAIEALSQMKRSASDFKMRRSAARALKKIKNKHL